MEKETEVRFLEIDKDDLVQKLLAKGATDHGEVMLEEVIAYDKELTWINQRRFVRLRKSGDTVKITYKEHASNILDGAQEIEFEIGDFEKGVLLIEKLGCVAYRRQQKKRHKLTFGKFVVDIDTWPRVPTYVEFEGPSHEELKEFTESLGFDWSKVMFEDARYVLENIYHIPMGTMHWLTIDRFE